MRTYRIILSIGVLLLACIFTYVSFMYVYTDHMFAPITPLQAPNALPVAYHDWVTPQSFFIHRVNTPQRAHRKDQKFNGFEIDILSHQGKLLVAHDLIESKRNVQIEDIFAAVKNPAEKVWWLDIKGELSNEEIDTILRFATQYNIPAEHLLFEVAPGDTAKRINKKKLSLLLPLPDGFDEDQNDPDTRAQLNAKAFALWEQYKPLAVSASFGKYAYLKAYFPNIPKAIYYSATQRPSIKKIFMQRHMAQDPSVKIFMTDEYTWINL